ncbi:hypothetical protein ASF98_22500 [Arthrobacter sp. Leaf337]|nr:hypothetical protein ASF98_22500 [Arthrobacter sp. Leaf337]
MDRERRVNPQHWHMMSQCCSQPVVGSPDVFPATSGDVHEDLLHWLAVAIAGLEHAVAFLCTKETVLSVILIHMHRRLPAAVAQLQSSHRRCPLHRDPCVRLVTPGSAQAVVMN